MLVQLLEVEICRLESCFVDSAGPAADAWKENG